MGNEGQVVRRGALKQDFVEASFQIRHTDLLSLPELCPVLPHVIELVLILGRPFINLDGVLAYLVGLPRLNACF